MPRGRKTQPPSTDLVPAQQVLPGETETDRELLDQAVHDLNRIYTEKGLETVLALGQYILDTFFAGNPATFQARGSEHVTFRELAARDDLHVSYATLWRAVSVVDQMKQLPEPVARQLPPTHHAALLPLKDEKKKAELATKAVDKGWSKQELEREVRKVKGKSAAGRPPLPRFVKTVHHFGKLLQDADETFGDLEDVDDLDPQEAQALWQSVTGMKLKCEELQKALQRKVPGFERPDGG